MIKKKLQKSFIKLLSLVIVIIFLFGMILFYSTMKFTFLNYAHQANSHLVNQIKSSFELVIDQITDKVDKLGIYESELVNIVETRKETVLKEMELYQKLNSIILENKYLHSAYLYSEKEEIIFDSKTGCTYSVNDFYDTYVAKAMEEKHFSRVNPHIIRNMNVNMDLLYSLVVVLPDKTKEGYATVLSLNVDMNKLYQDIMKRNTVEDDVTLYIYDQDNQIIVSPNMELIAANMSEFEMDSSMEMINPPFWSLFSNKSGVMDAYGHSKLLDWNFYLQAPFTIDLSDMINEYITLLFICVTIILFIGIIYIVIRHTTKPLDSFLYNYNENVMKALLEETNFKNNKSYMELESIKQLFCYDDFLLLLIDVGGAPSELFKYVSSYIIQNCTDNDKIFIKPITMYHGMIAIVCNYTHVIHHSLIEKVFIQELYHKLNNTYKKEVYIAVSTGKKRYSELSMAMIECEEILEYKLSLPERIMTYDKFAVLKGDIDYPINYEKQIVNNLLVANMDNCIFYLDKYMNHLFLNHSIISDMNIKNYIYQLQAELLKHISSLPISIKTSSNLDLKDIPDKEYVYDYIVDLIQTICIEITKKNNKNENILLQSILDYIEDHLSDDNFNLNTISYQFNMNRNYLAKLIKENTSYSFNDYVNYKKVEISKELLRDDTLTIEEISNKVGFNYSHYFIKIFKNVEGVTPGAYRKMLVNNNDAPKV